MGQSLVDAMMSDLCGVQTHGFVSPEIYAFSWELNRETRATGYTIDKRLHAYTIGNSTHAPTLPTCDQYRYILSERMAKAFFIVSAWHRHVGFVGDYYENPDFLSMSWKAGEAFGRPKQHMITSIVNVFTSTSQPLLREDYTHLF